MPLSRLFQAHMRELLSLEDAAIARLIGPYREAQAELTQRLLELESLGDGETFGAQRLALMRAQLAAVLSVLEGRQQDELRQALQEAVQRGGVQQVAEIADLERRFGALAVSELVGLVQPVIPAAASAVISDAAGLLISRFRNEVQYDVSQALAQSVIQGEGIAQAARRLGRTMQEERWKLERIARTEIGNAMNTGHQATIEQVADQFPEMGLQKQWSAHLDSRTSPRCKGLHLQVRETKQLFTARDGWQGMNPPAHPNCRSRVVAYSSRWERGSAQRIAEQAPGTARNPEAASRPSELDRQAARRSNAILRPHVIRSADVPRFLSGSAVPQPVFHSTSPEAARNIRRNGVDVTMGRIQQYGQGFYMSLSPLGGPYGNTPVQLAVRTLNPLRIITQFDTLAAVSRLNRAAKTPAEARQALVTAGYDSIIVSRPDGNDYVIAIREDNVRVIE